MEQDLRLFVNFLPKVCLSKHQIILKLKMLVFYTPILDWLERFRKYQSGHVNINFIFFLHNKPCSFITKLSMTMHNASWNARLISKRNTKRQTCSTNKLIQLEKMRKRSWQTLKYQLQQQKTEVKKVCETFWRSLLTIICVYVIYKLCFNSWDREREWCVCVCVWEKER